MTEVRDRPSVGGAAMLLFVATVIIVLDLRVPDLDIIADAVGGILVVVAAVRIHAAINGADGLRTALVVLAVLALPVTVLETLTPSTGEVGLLGLSQLIGTIVLARLLADAFIGSEPGLAATWLTCYHLLIWLALLPFVAGVLIGRLADGTSVESPLVVVLLVVLGIPLVATLHALWRTAQAPAASDPAATQLTASCQGAAGRSRPTGCRDLPACRDRLARSGRWSPVAAPRTRRTRERHGSPHRDSPAASSDDRRP